MPKTEMAITRDALDFLSESLDFGNGNGNGFDLLVLLLLFAKGAAKKWKLMLEGGAGELCHMPGSFCCRSF